MRARQTNARQTTAIARRTGLGQQPLHALAVRPTRPELRRVAQPRRRAAHGSTKARFDDRLEPIIDRLELEGPNGVLVVGRDEYDERLVDGRRLAQHLEPVEAWHLNVEEDEIGTAGGDGFD